MTRRPLRLALLAIAACSAALAVTTTRQGPPPPTQDGQFDGTWYRVEPGVKQMLQLRRAAPGKPWELRVKWQTREGFDVDTNWQPRTEIHYRGFGGTLELEPRPGASTADRLVFRYHREQKGSGAALLVEDGDVQLYRSNTGRNLVWLQDPLHASIKVAEPKAPYEADGQNRDVQRAWIFMKVSKRLVPWDEVPW